LQGFLHQCRDVALPLAFHRCFPHMTIMPKPRLTIRSARARKLAYKLARDEGYTPAEIVERALEQYARTQIPAIDLEFWDWMRREYEPLAHSGAIVSKNGNP
jgi:hypothetical protein